MAYCCDAPDLRNAVQHVGDDALFVLAREDDLREANTEIAQLRSLLLRMRLARL